MRPLKLLLPFCLCFFTLLAAKAQFTGNTYAVVAGLNKYMDTGLNNLTYTINDTKKMYEYLTSAGGGNVPAANIKMLTNEEATDANILDALKTYFSKATADDRVIFYFSGHGAPGEFAPYNLERVPGAFLHGLKHEDVRQVFKSCKAKIKICFADACFSGTIRNQLSAGTKNAMEQSKQLALDQSNILIMMSSKVDEESKEMKYFQEGVFTYNLLQGLRGKADLNADKKITVKELYSYVRQRVRAFTKAAQTPVAFGKFDPEMVVVKLK